MIEKSTGNLTIDNKETLINNKLTESDFIKSDLYNDVYNTDKNCYTNYYLNPQNIGGNKFSITLIFDPHGKIFIVKLRIIHGENLSSWSNWSENGEQEIKKEHDTWLEASMEKPPYHYLWGTISSNYDPRSASSSIIFFYKE